MAAPHHEKPPVGGQAVIEGVMMRSPRCLAVAVRRSDGAIVLRENPWLSLAERFGFLRWPLIRGAVVVAESLVNGVQALHFAAQQAELDASGRPAKAGTASTIPPDDSSASATPTSGAGLPSPGVDEPAGATGATIAFAFVLAVGLFVGLPHGLALLAGWLSGRNLDVDSVAFHALDGVFKLAIFVGYIAAIRQLADIRRVFQYHGAEHKVVNAYERGEPMTLDSARQQTTFHARCGTSFVLFVLFLSIVLFAVVLPELPRVFEHGIANHLAMILIKIPLMFPLAGVAYEINRYASRRPHQLWVQALVGPGRLMQRLTTDEPSDDQLEVALTAMQATLVREASVEANMAGTSPCAGRVASVQEGIIGGAAVAGAPSSDGPHDVTAHTCRETKDDRDRSSVRIVVFRDFQEAAAALTGSST